MKSIVGNRNRLGKRRTKYQSHGHLKNADISQTYMAIITYTLTFFKVHK